MKKFFAVASRRAVLASSGSAPLAMRRGVRSNAIAVSATATSALRFHGHSHNGVPCNHDHGHSHASHGHSHDGVPCNHDHGHSHGDGEMCYHDHGHSHGGGFVAPEADPAKIVPEDHPLMAAARAGDAAALRKLFDDAEAAGTPLDASVYQVYMITPLHEAADLGHTECCAVLLEKGAPLDAQMQDGQTPLHVAAFNGHVATVELLLENRADMDARNELAYTPLHSAIAKGHIDVMKALLEAGADVDAACMDGLSCLQLAVLFASTPNPSPISRNAPAGTNQTEVTPDAYEAVARFLIGNGANIGAQDDAQRTVLHTAAERNSTRLLSLIIDTVKTHPEAATIVPALVNSPTVEGVTALHIATAHNNVPAVRLLVEAGAVPNAQADQHTTPLHTAAGKGAFEVLDYLLEVRKAADGDAWPAALTAGPEATAIHFAAQEGHVRGIEALLNAGALVSAAIGSGDTPLHLAASGGHLDAVRFLLSKGADVNAVNSDGIMPIHTAASANSEATVEALVAAGAHVGAITAAGWSPLHIAASNGAEESVEFLVKQIAKSESEEAAVAAVNATIGGAKWTALHLAAQGNHSTTVEALLNAGAEPNAPGANSLCALHFAAQFDDINSVSLLLKKGANASAADGNGRTPLHVAAMFEHPAITKRLIAAKADTTALVKGTDGDSYAALHIAASAGSVDNVELLVVEAKADVNGRSKPGEKTALHVAALAKDVPVIAKLLSLGADPLLKNAEGKAPADLATDEAVLAALRKE